MFCVFVVVFDSLCKNWQTQSHGTCTGLLQLSSHTFACRNHMWNTHLWSRLDTWTSLPCLQSCAQLGGIEAWLVSQTTDCTACIHGSVLPLLIRKTKHTHTKKITSEEMSRMWILEVFILLFFKKFSNIVARPPACDLCGHDKNIMKYMIASHQA